MCQGSVPCVVCWSRKLFQLQWKGEQSGQKFVKTSTTVFFLLPLFDVDMTDFMATTDGLKFTNM